MAAVDALLRLVKPRDGEALVLTAGQPPGVVSAQGTRALSMPPLGGAMIEAFAREVVPDGEFARLDEGADLACEHASETGGTFAVSVVREDGDLVLTFRAAGAPPAAAAGVAAATPPVAAVVVQAAAPAGEGVGAPSAIAPESPASLPALAAVPTAAAFPVDDEDARDLALMLGAAANRSASDVWLSEGSRPFARIDHVLRELPGPTVTEAALLALLGPALTPAHRETLARSGSVDLALLQADPRGGPPRRFRVNAFRQSEGLSAAFRPLPTRIPRLEDLGLPGSLRSMVAWPHGLVLLTGPTGSGKSTTLASLVEHVNETRACHIITIEDPIEYRFERRRALIHQREVGAHVSDFASGLRAALREAPDVILVGEMRDRETIAAALTAAETGHLVLSTLHCGNAPMAVDRILDVFPERQQAQVRLQLADVLRAVVSQHLLPAREGGGRVPALEILRMNAAIANLIREGKTHNVPSYLQTGRGEGMVSLDASLADLVRVRRISRDAAFAATTNPPHLAELLGVPVPAGR